MPHILTESRCLPLDPRRHGGTPICQNSVLFPNHTNTILPPLPFPPPELPQNSTWAVSFLGGEAENETHFEQHERKGMGSIKAGNWLCVAK